MSLVKQILEVSRAIDSISDMHNMPQRTRSSVLRCLTSEVGELSEEVDIAEGTSYKVAGPDGVVGEAVDVIINALDLIYKERPDISEHDLGQIAALKLVKWMDKCKDHARQKYLERLNETEPKRNAT